MYIDVLPLDEVKLYLKIDDDQTETDAEITAMISGALQFIERRTNILAYAREKTYYADCSVNVYDFPINTTTITGTIRNGYTIYLTSGNPLVLNVGYIDPLEYPYDLKQAALQMIKVWFYESEKQVNTTLVPMSVLEVLDANRRYIC